MTDARDAQESLPQAILVAVDFSTCSLRALDVALQWKAGAGEVFALHVVDVNLARRLERLGLGVYDEAVAKMRAQAESKFAELVQERGEGKFDTMIAEGLPFAEICKIAKDLDCDLVVMGKYGNAPELKDFLFGGTAEKVLRGARQPVLCVP
jgi:nucleotide-binding universal stress UspA family protein